MMPTDQRAVLSEIRTFPSLVRYLRDEMGWPIGGGDFEELGIDTKNAAKIQEIKRLRPLATGQPWGIVFVKFEPKRLPVVALRRILSQVALKKRASANPAERTAWAADDLLLVSNYGEGNQRQISLAHFSGADSSRDLPTSRCSDGTTWTRHSTWTTWRRGSPATLPGPTTKTTSKAGAEPGAAPSPYSTVRSSPPHATSPSGWPSWPAPSATASRRHSPSRRRQARSRSS